MKCFLKDADAKQDEDEMICNWVAEIREAAYDAEDVIEAFAFRVALRRRRGLQNILKRYAFIFSELMAVHMVGTEIDAIKNKLSSLTASLQRYNWGGGKYKDFGGTAGGTRQEMLHCVHICSISQHLDIRAVVQGILIKLTAPSGEQRREIDNMSDDEVLERLYKIQEEKKCLVVLDDVWRRQDWESLRPAFPIRKEGSKIVVTTRCQAASIVDPNMAFFHQPKFLTGEESWELLQRKALPTRNDNGTDPSIDNVEELGKEMVRYCGGLPLAIVVLGGLLATKHTFYEWERVHRNIKSYLRRGKDNYEQQGSGVSDVLALSYQDLPYYLKSCFLYLANFPEDYEIPTRPHYKEKGIW
ncbi:putative disease resistance protein [Vitis vinifera]|uniref:Putative disease resistance protein n=1 Tax=Vitis vinifera TaxID=29760 RepID=A0A438HET8_VITVI|nr:putative disease resistance protein [Vitis vinifera]